MPPKKQRPGSAAAPGQYQCRKSTRDPSGKILSVCLQPVPAGELTHVSLNSTMGHFLHLCVEHRQKLADDMLEWIQDADTTARLLFSLTELENGVLVSSETLREALAQAGESVGAHGPLTEAQRKRAIELVSTTLADG